MTNTPKRDAEQRERNEMFSFHPEILSAAAPLPRRDDDHPYTAPDTPNK